MDGSGRMFDRIAHRYDRLNRILSLGMDQRWRRIAVDALALASGSAQPRVLDLATGTGDVAIEIARRFPSARVVGVDPSPGMLKVGSEKIEREGLGARIELKIGQAQEIPAENDAFDAAIMAFGIRNTADRPACLKELMRVVRSGGSIVLLELTEPEGHVLSFGARLWKRRMAPRLGAWFSSAPEYAYLEKSIRAFPSPEVFAAMMVESGLGNVKTKSLTLGAVAVFSSRCP